MADNYYNVGEAKDFIKKFLNSQFGQALSLDEQLEKLKTFSFWDIKDKNLYRNNKNYPDGDCTNLAYAIAWCLWGDTLKKCKTDYSFDLLLKESAFSGETLNTFRTLFKNEDKYQKRVADLWGKDDFLRKVKNVNNGNKDDFYHIYQMIGNFSLLPKLGKYSGQSINQRKGTSSEIKDYLYPFMNNLKEAYKVSLETNQHINMQEKHFLNELVQLIRENSYFFDVVNSFENFVKIFMLEEWEELELCEYIRSSELNEKNIDIAKKYVENASRFIKNRTKRIVEVLKEKLTEN